MPGFEFPKETSTQVASSNSVDAPRSVLLEPKINIDNVAEGEHYYNPRLDAKNFLEGELSWNPATRLRQMLARPGIVVAPGICDGISARYGSSFLDIFCRWYSNMSAIKTVRRLRPASPVCTRVAPPRPLHALVSLTLRSQP
jgi:hypothetical protein